jgi:hypothetical protein
MGATELAEAIRSARTRTFVSALFAVAGEPSPAAIIESFMTRQSLQRSWGEFQQAYPLILAPAYTGLPFAPGADLTTPQVARIVAGMRMSSPSTCSACPPSCFPPVPPPASPGPSR